jgi:signal transduction histidine kinase
VRAAARDLLARLRHPPLSSGVRAARIDPENPDEPGFTLVAVEAIPILLEEVAITPLMMEWLQPLMLQAERQGVTLALHCAPKLPRRIVLDPNKTAWVITTLIGGALRYMVLPGRIDVDVSHSASDQRLRIAVRDDGPGMPPRLQRWLFAPNPETGRPKAVALRLVQEVVTAHGGGMLIKSPAEPGGKGTEITVYLPTGRGEQAQ